MGVIFVNYKRTLLDQVELDALFTCTKCGSDKWLLNTEETKATVLLGSATQVKASVVCEGCSKKIAKKYLNSEIRQLAAEKDLEFKPSFFKRYGLFIISIVLFVGIISYATIDTVLDHNKVVKDAKESFAKAYGEEAKKAWLDNVQPGDFLLCSKNYNDPATVFQVKEITPDAVTLSQFEQSVPRTDFENLEILGQLTLGTGNSRDVEVSKRNFNRNIIALDDDSRNDFSIQQIRKKK